MTFGLAADAIDFPDNFDLLATPGPSAGDPLVYDALAMRYRPRGAAVDNVEDASYTLDPDDAGRAKVLTGISGGPIDAVLAADMPEGFRCTVIQGGIGEIVFLPETGAMLVNWQMHAQSAGQYARCELIVIENPGDAAVWLLSGDTAA